MYFIIWVSAFATQSAWKNYTDVPSLMISLLLWIFQIQKKNSNNDTNAISKKLHRSHNIMSQ